MSQVLGAFGLLDFTMLWPVLTWQEFWNLWTIYFFNFPIFFRAAVNRSYWISGCGGVPVFYSSRLEPHSVSSTTGQPTSNELKLHLELKHISLLCQSLHIQNHKNHNLCTNKFQVVYSIDYPSPFWEMVLRSCTCTATFQKSLVSLPSWLCLEDADCKNLQHINKLHINTVQSPRNKIHINTESLHFIRLNW
jgi:hypothetical protein